MAASGSVMPPGRLLECWERGSGSTRDLNGANGVVPVPNLGQVRQVILNLESLLSTQPQESRASMN